MILIEIAKQLLLPPGIIVLALLFCFTIGLRRRLLAQLSVLLLTLVMYFISTPIGSFLLTQPLYEPAVSQSILNQIRGQKHYAIVVLGNGRIRQAPEYFGADVATARGLKRLQYAAFLQKLTGLPILVSGGKRAHEKLSEADLMKNDLQMFFNTSVKFIEGHSKNTRENATFSSVALTKAGIDHILLVSHASHMLRAKKLFEEQNIKVIPAGTNFLQRPQLNHLSAWLPSNIAFNYSFHALYEWLGLTWLYLGG